VIFTGKYYFRFKISLENLDNPFLKFVFLVQFIFIVIVLHETLDSAEGMSFVFTSITFYK